jgi:hypothetical protein
MSYLGILAVIIAIVVFVTVIIMERRSSVPDGWGSTLGLSFVLSVVIYVGMIIVMFLASGVFYEVSDTSFEVEGKQDLVPLNTIYVLEQEDTFVAARVEEGSQRYVYATEGETHSVAPSNVIIEEHTNDSAYVEYQKERPTNEFINNLILDIVKKEKTVFYIPEGTVRFGVELPET